MIFQKIFLFGIDNSGKTSLSEALRTGKYEGNYFPTTTWDIKALFLEHFKESIEFSIWDAPGQVCYRDTWCDGYTGASLMIFVLDTAAKNRFEEAKEALENVLKDERTDGIPLVFLFHKIDLEDARQNYYGAQDMFKPSLIQKRDVYQLHTSIKYKITLDDLRELIATIVDKKRKSKILVPA
ncbi:MAG: ADP-ribosylation factor-like protein [Promethearchaeota archaeon]